MTKAVAKTKNPMAGFTPEQKDMITNWICKDANDIEIQVFLETCRELKLSPFLKEVYFFKNSWWSRKENKQIENCVIGVGINGYRKIAERTGRYAPGKATEYQLDNSGMPISATAYVKKLTDDGTWHEVACTVFMAEFPGAAKSSMPFHKLGINAESHALRRAFPEAYNGIYSKEEIETSDFKPAGADEEDKTVTPQAIDKSVTNDTKTTISEKEFEELDDLIGEDETYRGKVLRYLQKAYKVSTLEEMPKEVYPQIKAQAIKNLEALEEVQMEA